MNAIRTAFLCLALAALLGGVAHAQGDQGDQQVSSFQLKDGWAVAITPGGKMTRRSDVSPDMLSELTKDAKPMTAGSILLMRDHKLYVVPDRPTQGGMMLSEKIARPPAR